MYVKIGILFTYCYDLRNRNSMYLLTLRYQTCEGFPQWGQFFRNNF